MPPPQARRPNTGADSLTRPAHHGRRGHTAGGAAWLSPRLIPSGPARHRSRRHACNDGYRAAGGAPPSTVSPTGRAGWWSWPRTRPGGWITTTSAPSTSCSACSPKAGAWRPNRCRRWGSACRPLRQEVEQIIGRGQQKPSRHIPLTPRAKKVLELSLREALRLGHSYIGTEHILLGLIREGGGVAAQVLTRLGAEHDRVAPRSSSCWPATRADAVNPRRPRSATTTRRATRRGSRKTPRSTPGTSTARPHSAKRNSGCSRSRPGGWRNGHQASTSPRWPRRPSSCARRSPGCATSCSGTTSNPTKASSRLPKPRTEADSGRGSRACNRRYARQAL